MRELQAEAALRELEADARRRAAERAAAPIGYGDQPLGVPLSQISRLSQAAVITFIDGRFNDNDLDGAINAAYAWSVQARGGDHAGFNWLLERLGDDMRRFDVMVARDRAQQVIISGAGDTIRTQNENGVNFGSQIYELQRAIDNDRDNAYAYIYRYLSYINRAEFVGFQRTAFRDLMGTMGHSRELDEATYNLAQRSYQDWADEQNTLARMSVAERAQWGLGRAFDLGAFGPSEMVGLGMAMGTIIGGWVRPLGWFGPSDLRGTWSGDRGNSDFILNDATARALGLPVGTRVTFVNGRPDLSPFLVNGPSNVPGSGTFHVPGLTGDPTGDQRLIRGQMARELNWTVRDVDRWLGGATITPHHAGGTLVQLIPTNIHEMIRHTGGAADLRRGR
jgi:hypothetical protein